MHQWAAFLGAASAAVMSLTFLITFLEATRREHLALARR
jgi:hypothetical protein